MQDAEIRLGVDRAARAKAFSGAWTRKATHAILRPARYHRTWRGYARWGHATRAHAGARTPQSGMALFFARSSSVVSSSSASISLNSPLRVRSSTFISILERASRLEAHVVIRAARTLGRRLRERLVLSDFGLEFGHPGLEGCAHQGDAGE